MNGRLHVPSDPTTVTQKNHIKPRFACRLHLRQERLQCIRIAKRKVIFQDEVKVALIGMALPNRIQLLLRKQHMALRARLARFVHRLRHAEARRSVLHDVDRPTGRTTIVLGNRLRPTVNRIHHAEVASPKRLLFEDVFQPGCIHF